MKACKLQERGGGRSLFAQRKAKMYGTTTTEAAEAAAV